MLPFSVYIHIPFCLRRCPYCDFNSYVVSAIPEKEYVAALLAEVDYRATRLEWHGRQIRTLYFGGGTPSLFSPFSIRKIVEVIASRFPIADDVEISLEANPGTIGPESLGALRRAGVNRLSLGAQTFNDDFLRALGRLHTAEQIEAALSAARAAEFVNVSLDLLYGLAGQSLPQLKDDIAKIIALQPEHVSAYGLTIEEGTPYFTQFKKGRLLLPDEENSVAMFEELKRALSQAGYRHYEISNFAYPGREAKHNLVYWNCGDYLGLGAGAHSSCAFWEGTLRAAGTRWANYAAPATYMEQVVAHGRAEGWQESLSTADLMFEFFFLGLRKLEGVSCSEFERWFGSSIEQVYPEILQILYDQDLLKRDGDYISLTNKGLLLADNVIENFILDGERLGVPSLHRSTEAAHTRAANQ